MGNSVKELIVEQITGPPALLPLVSTFADLSAGTEFGYYKDPQWRFLLSGEEIDAFVAIDSGGGEDYVLGNVPFDGCVLRVHLDDDTVGFGMVLVKPSKRGRGIARLLIEKAMLQIDATAEGEKKRFVLAVCSSLGQPIYRKLGFKDAGMVTFMTCSLSDMLQTPRKQLDNEYNMFVKDGKECKNEQLDLLVNLDAKATGIKRRDRIKLLLNGGYAEGSRSTVAFLSTAGSNCFSDAFLGDGDDDFEVSSNTAVARQDYAGGPLIIGPMKGRDEHCIPLMHALIEKHFEHDERVEIGDVCITMMVTDHPNLVTRLLEIEGMKKVWEHPAMTSDGKPVYNGDGSYLAMMHPTLG
ncbi:hypothetical protein ACHAXR_008190 [Thalassiosira sp. AJA248-18]